MKTTFKFAAAGLIAAALAHAPAFAQEATGAGASFPAPLYSKWASDFNKATGAKINYQSVGSGAGIKQIDAKTVDFGASDMPLSDEDLKAKGLLQFPTVIGGVVPVVNIQGIKAGEFRNIDPNGMVPNTDTKLSHVHSVGSRLELSTSLGGRSDSDTR